MSGTGESLSMGFPPVVTQETERTHCVCGEALHPHVLHKCKHNEEWQPPVSAAPEAAPESGTAVGITESGAVDKRPVYSTGNANEILPGLWLGDWNDAMLWKGATLNVRDAEHYSTETYYVGTLVPPPEHWGIQWCVSRQRLDQCADIISKHLANDSRALLVHCLVGMERSPLVIAWWLVRTGRQPNLNAATAWLKSKRSIVENRTSWIEDEKPRQPEYGNHLLCSASNDVPIGAEGCLCPTNLTEQQKYELMWSKDQYRQVAPGEHIANQFLALVQPREGSTIIDFGCGTGRGAFMLALFGKGLKIDMVDFAANCLDTDVKEIMAAQPHALSFTQCDLTKPIPKTAEFGFCTDVMEHIPPADVDKVLSNVLASAQHVFFQISCTEDHCGTLIGHTLHLSVHPPRWWYEKLVALGCEVHYYKAAPDDSACVIYATAWATGKNISEVGVLNIEEEKARANVRTNTAAGYTQVKPHIPQPKEVIIVGGGPSLPGQLETIRQMRAEGKLLVTLNGAYNWAIENELSVSGTIVVDAREFNARFTKPVLPGVHYMLGSQCDPAVFEGLPKEQVYIWNTSAEMVKDILDELVPNEWYGISGGCTVLLRAIPLLRMLGYMKFHLFGCDSCVAADTHHGYAQPENDGTPVFPTIVGGRVFQCTPWQVAQAEQFMQMIRVMGELFELTVHGDGLLAWILEHGANLDIEREEAEELADVASMK